jgi:hypothetical protein
MGPSRERLPSVQVSAGSARRRSRAVRNSCFPWPACGHPECHRAGAAGDPPGDGEQPAAQRPSGGDDHVGQPDQGRPAQQVVRERGDHCPGGVREELAGGEVRQAWSLRSRIASSTTACWRCSDSTSSSGRCGWSETRSAASRATARPARRSGGCGARSAAGEPSIVCGDLRLPVLGVVLKGCQSCSGICRDRCLSRGVLHGAHRSSRLQPASSRRAMIFSVPEPRVRAQQLRRRSRPPAPTRGSAPR